jgi:hypothetical protein
MYCTLSSPLPPCVPHLPTCMSVCLPACPPVCLPICAQVDLSLGVDRPPPPLRTLVPWHKQYRVLLSRTLKEMLRRRSVLLTQLGQTLIMAVLVGTVFLRVRRDLPCCPSVALPCKAACAAGSCVCYCLSSGGDVIQCLQTWGRGYPSSGNTRTCISMHACSIHVCIPASPLLQTQPWTSNPGGCYFVVCP